MLREIALPQLGFHLTPYLAETTGGVGKKEISLPPAPGDYNMDSRRCPGLGNSIPNSLITSMGTCGIGLQVPILLGFSAVIECLSFVEKHPGQYFARGHSTSGSQTGDLPCEAKYSTSSFFHSPI